MIRILLISAIVLITLSQCDDGVNAGAPKSKKVVVHSSPNTEKGSEKVTASTSSMNAEQIEKANKILNSISEKEVAAINAKKIFKINCASCHGFTGDLGINGSKDLTASKISLTEAIAQVYHGKGLMTPYKDILSEAELVAVAKYTETLRK